MNTVRSPHTDLPDPESATRFLIAVYGRAIRRDVSETDRRTRAFCRMSLTLVSLQPAARHDPAPKSGIYLVAERKRLRLGRPTKEELLESLARFSLTNSQIEPQVLFARFRRRELLRIFLRDIRRLATIAEITEEISNLADAILENALRIARQEIDNRFGLPLEVDEKGTQTTVRVSALFRSETRLEANSTIRPTSICSLSILQKATTSAAERVARSRTANIS